MANVTKWDKETCQALAITCKTRKELSDKSRVCYTTSHRKGWLDEICSHMQTIKRKKPNHWTIENCKLEAIKYKTRSEFEENNLGAYTKARRQNWLDEICSHMNFIERGKLEKKKLYTFKWIKEKMVYIGITNNPKRRIHDHLKESSNHYIKTLIGSGNNPLIDILPNWYTLDEIVLEEQETIDNYKLQGWNVLNINRGGALGGTTVKWTAEACYNQALKYKSRGEFEENESGCFKASVRLGIYEDICSHMEFKRMPFEYWTKELCKIEADKYINITRFQKTSSGAYNVAKKKKWLDDICGHMISSKKPNGYWNKENCKNESLKYSTRVEFYRKNSSAYTSSLKNNWLDEFY